MNEQEFNSIVLPVGQRLFMLCCKILNNREDAKDALQDVFIKLWTGRDELKNLKNINAYATTITRNLCFDRLRTKKTFIDENQIKGLSNDQQQEDNERTKDKIFAISEALNKLNEQQKQVFTMRDIENMEYNDIADRLGISPENVRVILSRARNRVREIIKGSRVLI
jgi:RNA polymerase sigma-70 factor (ECF subfamily)